MLRLAQNRSKQATHRRCVKRQQLSEQNKSPTRLRSRLSLLSPVLRSLLTNPVRTGHAGWFLSFFALFLFLPLRFSSVLGLLHILCLSFLWLWCRPGNLFCLSPPKFCHFSVFAPASCFSFAALFCLSLTGPEGHCFFQLAALTRVNTHPLPPVTCFFSVIVCPPDEMAHTLSSFCPGLAVSSFLLVSSCFIGRIEKWEVDHFSSLASRPLPFPLFLHTLSPLAGRWRAAGPSSYFV